MSSTDETMSALIQQVQDAKNAYFYDDDNEELEKRWKMLKVTLKKRRKQNKKQSSDETKETLKKEVLVETNNVMVDLTYLGIHLIQPQQYDDVVKRVRNPKDLWQRIFSFAGPTYFGSRCRSLCRLFRSSLQPCSLWTTFPNPNYSTLRELMNHLNQLSKSNKTVPAYLFIGNGVYTIKMYQDEWEDEYNTIDIEISLTIVGESRHHCIIEGGFVVVGNKSNHVNVNDLTIQNSKANGILGNDGGTYAVDNLSIRSCRNGTWSYNTTGTVTNCEISHCRRSGLSSGKNGLIVIKGGTTRVHSNCTSNDTSAFGLRSCDTNSRIQIVAPLTKQIISTNHGDDKNYGGNGTIEIIEQ
jgi:hypothetical protein